MQKREPVKTVSAAVRQTGQFDTSMTNPFSLDISDFQKYLNLWVNDFVNDFVSTFGESKLPYISSSGL